MPAAPSLVRKRSLSIPGFPAAPTLVRKRSISAPALPVDTSLPPADSSLPDSRPAKVPRHVQHLCAPMSTYMTQEQLDPRIVASTLQVVEDTWMIPKSCAAYVTPMLSFVSKTNCISCLLHRQFCDRGSPCVRCHDRGDNCTRAKGLVYANIKQSRGKESNTKQKEIPKKNKKASAKQKKAVPPKKNRKPKDEFLASSDTILDPQDASLPGTDTPLDPQVLSPSDPGTPLDNHDPDPTFDPVPSQSTPPAPKRGRKRKTAPASGTLTIERKPDVRMAKRTKVTIKKMDPQAGKPPPLGKPEAWSEVCSPSVLFLLHWLIYL